MVRLACTDFANWFIGCAVLAFHVLLRAQGPTAKTLKSNTADRAGPNRRREAQRSLLKRAYRGPLLYQRPLPYQPPPPSNSTRSTTIRIVSMEFLHFLWDTTRREVTEFHRTTLASKIRRCVDLAGCYQETRNYSEHLCVWLTSRWSSHPDLIRGSMDHLLHRHQVYDWL